MGLFGVGILRLVVKRAVASPVLVLFTLAGLVLSVALVSAVPLYSDGVSERLLRQELAKSGNLPPLAIRVRHLEDRSRPTTLDQFRRLDKFLTGDASAVVGLPVRNVVRYLSTKSHSLYDRSQEELPKVYIPGLARYAEIASLSQLDEHIRVIAGARLPNGPSPSGEVPVILTASAADELRMDVGERYWYVGPDLERPEKLTIQVVGIWEPLDPGNADYWGSALPDVTYNYTLFVNEADFFENVLPAFRRTQVVKEYSWYLIFDQRALYSARVERVRSGLRNLELDAARLMPDMRTDDSPAETLDWFTRQSSMLKTLLFVLSVPLLAIAMYYVFISVTMVVDQQRGEVAFLRSRGASPFQVVLIYLVEGLVMGALAMVIGILIGVGVSQMVGKAYGFLQFAIRAPLPVFLTRQVIEYASLVIGLSVVCAIIPAARAARMSVVAYERHVGRVERSVHWTGLAFDVLCLAVAGYGYYSLKAGTPIVTAGKPGEFIVEPLLLVLPAIFIFAVALIFRRLLPLLAAAAAACLTPAAGATTVLALRQVYRAPSGHSPLAFLLVVTLAVGVFSASAARTIESNHADRARYGAPASLELAANWEFDPETGALLEPPLGAFWVPGVRAVTRAQPYTARPATGRDLLAEVQVLGVDRDTFAGVCWWRGDFTRNSLGALMNTLSVEENAAIVSPSYLEQHQLRIGDVVQLSFSHAGSMESKLVEFRIVESADYFPTLYPERSHFLVTNLDYLHDQLGLGMYSVWLSVDPSVKTSRIVEAIADNGVNVNRIRDQRVEINVGRLDPQRTGILGLLSLAFVVSALLTALGFFLHILLAFRQRTPQMGVLRTIGLSRDQLIRMLLAEQLFVVLLSVAAGIGFGLLTSHLFIPFLQVDIDRLGKTPPFVIEPAWTEISYVCLVLGLMLAAGGLAMLALIRHMKLHQALRLGGHV